jgi:predicted enzyme related to lactoylglutathione lyase
VSILARPVRLYGEEDKTMIKGLSGATIWSEDLNRLLPFYRDVLGLPVRMQTPAFVVFGADGAPALGLGTHSDVRGRNGDRARHMVGLGTDDATAEWKRLKAAGVEFVEDPTNYGNLWIATLVDPDGNLVQLFQPSNARVEALARQFEVKRGEAAAVLAKLSDADWKKVTAAEKWTVGVTAHHLAGAFEPVAGLVVAVVSGQSSGTFTRAMLDEMNAAHAKEHADCTKAETIALLEKGSATAAATVRGLSDEQLAERGVVFADAPPMSAEELIMGGLINHIDEHIGSIRKTVGL